MVPEEPKIAWPENSNADEREENDLKKTIKIIEELKEEIKKNSFKETPLKKLRKTQAKKLNKIKKIF